MSQRALASLLVIAAGATLAACGPTVPEPGKDDVLRVFNQTGAPLALTIVEFDGTTTDYLAIASFAQLEQFVSFGDGESITFTASAAGLTATGSCTADATTVSIGAGEVAIFIAQPLGTAIEILCQSNFPGFP